MARVIGSRGECAGTMTLEIDSEPRLRPQLEIRLSDAWMGFTVHVPWASEPEGLGPWIRKAAAVAASQDAAASLGAVFFVFSGPELSAANDSRIEELVQLWIKAFVAAGCWPELRESFRGHSAGARRVYETEARIQPETRESQPAVGGASESGVSERLYGHAQSSGEWLRALGASGGVPSTAPTPAPKQPVPASVLPTPPVKHRGHQARPAAKRSEIEVLAELVRKYIREYGAAPDFVSDKPAAVEKAHNYIRSTTARPNLTEDELERVRRTLAKK
jgi:hypothetical protein